jgi:hypothetical protein
MSKLVEFENQLVLSAYEQLLRRLTLVAAGKRDKEATGKKSFRLSLWILEASLRVERHKNQASNKEAKTCHPWGEVKNIPFKFM